MGDFGYQIGEERLLCKRADQQVDLGFGIKLN